MQNELDSNSLSRPEKCAFAYRVKRILRSRSGSCCDPRRRRRRRRRARSRSGGGRRRSRAHSLRVHLERRIDRLAHGLQSRLDPPSDLITPFLPRLVHRALDSFPTLFEVAFEFLDALGSFFRRGERKGRGVGGFGGQEGRPEMAQEFERRCREGRDGRMVSSRETCVWLVQSVGNSPTCPL